MLEAGMVAAEANLHVQRQRQQWCAAMTNNRIQVHMWTKLNNAIPCLSIFGTQLITVPICEFLCKLIPTNFVKDVVFLSQNM